MKRYFNLLLGAIALFCIASCDDVPAPYELNTTTSLTTEPTGSGTLADPYNVARTLYLLNKGLYDENATVYTKGVVTRVATDDDVKQYGNLTYYISDTGKANKELEIYRGYGLNGAKFTAYDDLQQGDTIIVKGNLKVHNGTPEFTQGSTIVYLSGKGGSTTPPAEITGDNLLANGDFETWEEGQPTNWKSASTAGNATLTQSTDAHGGSYSVAVTGTDQNKRIAYKELTLKAGTYTFAFYAKATKTDKCQCRPGYVPVTNGSVGSYAYGGYTNITTSGWTQVTHTFTLDAETTVCLVVMNPKGGTDYQDTQDILIDDATLVTADGGLADTGENPGTPDTPVVGSDLLSNGDFELWDNGLPTNWKSASTAGNATLTQSTDAHGGSYSVAVTGTDQNKRIAYKETTLKAGTYTFSFYGKATKTDKCQCRPGYVPVTNGSVGSYAYGAYTNLTTSGWTQVSHTFTLDTETTVCLVIMNPKGGTDYQDTQDILIDDATLTTTDGGLADAGETPDTPTPGEAKGDGTQANPFNVAAAIAKCIETGTTATTDDYYVEGIVSKLHGTYANTFWLSDDGKTVNELEFYYGTGLNGATLNSGDVKVGDKVLVKGKLVNYSGNTPELSKGCTIVSINGSTQGGTQGGEDPNTPDTPSTGDFDITADVNIALNTFSLDNAAKVTELTSDGIKLTFGKGDGKSEPAYYSATNGVRMYANNTLAITATKAIAKVALLCDSYNGTDYVGNATISAAPGAITVSGLTVGVSNVNSTTTTITNTYTESTGSGVQLRVKNILIEYAK